MVFSNDVGYRGYVFNAKCDVLQLRYPNKKVSEETNVKKILPNEY